MLYYIVSSPIYISKRVIKDVRVMKIEKINDNKIRCTLTSADLAERNLKLSELAYGTEKRLQPVSGYDA